MGEGGGGAYLTAFRIAAGQRYPQHLIPERRQDVSYVELPCLLIALAVASLLLALARVGSRPTILFAIMR